MLNCKNSLQVGVDADLDDARGWCWTIMGKKGIMEGHWIRVEENFHGWKQVLTAKRERLLSISMTKTVTSSVSARRSSTSNAA